MTTVTRAPRAGKPVSKIQQNPGPIVLDEAETPSMDMDFLLEPEAATPAINNALPPDIAAEKARLLGVRGEVEKYARWMDGLLFGYVGGDFLISLVPFVGDLGSAALKAHVFAKAREVRAPRAVQGRIVFYCLLDAAFSPFPFVGDVVDLFVRSHAWSASAITGHIDEQVREIDRVHELVIAGNGGQDAARWGELRARLF